LHDVHIRDHMMIMKSTPTHKPRRAYAQVARAAAAEATGTRIAEAFLELLLQDWFDDITLDRVASLAGVAVPTVVRRFGGKDGLLAAAVELLTAQINQRRASPPGDLSAIVDHLLADYERTGDAVIRLLALAPRYEAVEQATNFGRAQHRAWVSHAFAPTLATFKGAAIQHATDALVAATDVYTWKLLRRDLQRSPKDTARTMRTLIAAATKGE
jgi:AcrR family transcriptional regulator